MISHAADERRGAATFRPIPLGRHANFPDGEPAAGWMRDLKKSLKDYPKGQQTPWGIPFRMGDGAHHTHGHGHKAGHEHP